MRNIVCAAVLAVLSACAIAASPAEKPLPVPKATGQQPSADKRGTKEAPLAVEVLSVPQRTEEERAEQATERHEKAESDWWLVKLTGALVIATLALVGATVFLWLATKRLVKGAEDTAERQLRAYLVIETINISKFSDPPPHKVHVAIKNCGATPAYFVHIELECSDKRVVAGKVESFNLTRKGERPSSRSTVGPGVITRLRLDTPTPMSPQLQMEIERGDVIRYLFGRIKYFDAFGVPRWALLRNEQGGVGTIDGVMRISAEGNETSDSKDFAEAAQ